MGGKDLPSGPVINTMDNDAWCNADVGLTILISFMAHKLDDLGHAVDGKVDSHEHT